MLSSFSLSVCVSQLLFMSVTGSIGPYSGHCNVVPGSPVPHWFELGSNQSYTVLYRPLSPAITEITKTFNKTSYWVWPDPILKKLTCINRSGLTTKHLIWNESNPGQGHHSNILFSVNQGYVLTVVLACNSVCFLFSELSLLVYFYSCQQDTGWFQCNMDTNP